MAIFSHFTPGSTFLRHEGTGTVFVFVDAQPSGFRNELDIELTKITLRNVETGETTDLLNGTGSLPNHIVLNRKYGDTVTLRANDLSNLITYVGREVSDLTDLVNASDPEDQHNLTYQSDPFHMVLTAIGRNYTKTGETIYSYELSSTDGTREVTLYLGDKDSPGVELSLFRSPNHEYVPWDNEGVAVPSFS